MKVRGSLILNQRLCVFWQEDDPNAHIVMKFNGNTPEVERCFSDEKNAETFFFQLVQSLKGDA